jgi:hypothetical protein
MTQPLGNCPGCGADESFEQVHTGHCPDAGGADAVGDCPEWACLACGAGVIMGTVPSAEASVGTSARQSVRAA